MAAGPDNPPPIPLEIFDTQTIPGVTFPIDLNPININYTLNNFQDIYNINIGHLKKAHIQYNRFIKPFQITSAVDGSVLYKINVCLGHGAYGKVYTITDTTTGNEVCCKIQDPVGNNPINKIIKESVVQYILYQTTKNNDHYDCVYTPEIYKFFYDDMNAQVIIIQELIKGGVTFANLISDNLAQNASFHTPVLIRIARKLQNLWRLYEFNHGDFHSANILIINGNPRLIDFGRSAMRIPLGGGETEVSVEIPGPYEVTTRAESRDFTHLFADIERFYGNAISIYGNPIIQSAYINTGMRAILEPHAGAGNLPHFGCYTYFNSGGHVQTATPTSILNTFNSVNPIGDIRGQCFARRWNLNAILGAAGQGIHAILRRAADIPPLQAIIQINPATNTITINTNGILVLALGVAGAIYAVMPGQNHQGGTRKRRKYHKQKTMRGGKRAAMLKHDKNMSRFNKLIRYNLKKLNTAMPRLQATAKMSAPSTISLNINAEDIMTTSAEYILDYIRFNVFPEVDSTTMRAVLINLSTIPLCEPEIAHSLANSISSRSFEKLTALITKYSIPDLMKQTVKQKWPMNEKNIETAIDIYMTDPNPKTAIKLLRAYIYAKFPDKANHDAFVKWIMSLDAMGREYGVHDYYPNAFKI
jgi:serine/threonine protein kinase